MLLKRSVFNSVAQWPNCCCHRSNFLC